MVSDYTLEGMDLSRSRVGLQKSSSKGSVGSNINLLLEQHPDLITLSCAAYHSMYSTYRPAKPNPNP